jgi:hypothetical protein
MMWNGGNNAQICYGLMKTAKNTQMKMGSTTNPNSKQNAILWYMFSPMEGECHADLWNR